MSHELLVHFYAADQSHDGPYGIDQLGQRIEVGRHHRSGLHDAGSARSPAPDTDWRTTRKNTVRRAA